MDSSTIEFPGSEIESLTLEDSRLTVRFSRAIIIKTMSDSEERTRWWQAGALIFDEAEIEGDIPECPCVMESGDVGENVYTYRDMLPLPLESRGRAHCDLKFRDRAGSLRATASAVKLVMDDRPRYIEHLRNTPSTLD